MSFYNHTDKKSGDGLALTDWNNLSNAVAGNQGLTLALNAGDKVGVGIASPNHKLEVAGVIKMTGADFEIDAQERRGTQSGSRRRALVHNHGDKLTINYAGDYTGGVNIDGDVGIGTTTSPSEKLEVNGKVKATHFIGDGSQLTNLTVGLNGLNLATQGGNVGIGTPNPGHKLEVAGNIKMTGPDFEIDVQTRRGTQPGSRRRALVHDHGDKLTINHEGDYTGGVSIHGYVGIGTGTPAAPLSIAGNGKENHPDANMHITNDCILFGGSNNGRQGDSAQISAGKHESNSLNIVGMSTGTDYTTRKIACIAEGGFAIHGNSNIFTITTDGQKIYFHMRDAGHGGPGSNRVISWDGDANWDQVSDRNAKTDIESEPDILKRLMQLDVKNFRWKGGLASTPKTIGLIAQEVQPLFPGLVGEMPVSDGQEKQLTLKLGAFGVLAVGAIKELKAEIDALKAQIEPLTS